MKSNSCHNDGEMKKSDKNEPLFSKIWHNHFLMMAVCCVVPVVLILLVTYFYGPSKNLNFVISLICPIMMVIMMANMMKKNGGKCH